MAENKFCRFGTASLIESFAAEAKVAFLAQLLGAIMGAAAGYGLGEILLVGVGGATVDMRFILAGVGALVGFLIGRFIASFYERSESKSSGDDESGA